MTDKKISELSSITNAELDEVNDTMAIVDTSATQTKKITVSELLSNTPDLAAIAETIAKTAVDVFVYDTSLDSDGGAWRERTQQTSWYQEVGKFPAVALIVAEIDAVTIHDATDVNLPAWMVFTKGAGGYAIGGTAANITSVDAKDGKIVFGQTSSYGQIDFIKDQSLAKDAGSTFIRINPLSGRNAGGGNITTSANTILNAAVNDVAITVRDNAPFDVITGLSVPTIAVPNDGGVSAILEDDTVTDGVSASVSSAATFSDNGLWHNLTATGSRLLYATFDDIYAGDGWGDIIGDTDGVTGDFTLLTPCEVLSENKGTLAIGSATSNELGVAGLMLHKPNYADQTKGMSALITSDYNTGWMQGDIELALCDGLTDRSATGTTVTDNGTAVISVAATDSEQKKITATGGSITASVTTGGAIYGWEYIAGVPVFRAGSGWVGISEAAGTLTIVDGTAFSMLRYTNGAGPYATQYAEYEQSEKHILQEGSDCLLYGTSDAVTALTHDPVTDLLHVGTSDGRSDFQGLVRVNNTTNAVGAAISASNGLIADE